MDRFFIREFKVVNNRATPEKDTDAVLALSKSLEFNQIDKINKKDVVNFSVPNQSLIIPQKEYNCKMFTNNKKNNTQNKKSSFKERKKKGYYCESMNDSTYENFQILEHNINVEINRDKLDFSSNLENYNNCIYYKKNSNNSNKNIKFNAITPNIDNEKKYEKLENSNEIDAYFPKFEENDNLFHENFIKIKNDSTKCNEIEHNYLYSQMIHNSKDNNMDITIKNDILTKNIERIKEIVNMEMSSISRTIIHDRVPEKIVCYLCQNFIEDPYMNSLVCKKAKVMYRIHEKCNKCSICKNYVSGSSFIHEGNLYCKEDYMKYHLKDCNICGEKITPIVMYCDINNKKFACHEKCLNCSYCGNYLKEGSGVTLFKDKIYCLPCRDYIEYDNCLNCETLQDDIYEDINFYSIKNAKRPRTVLTLQQRNLFIDTFKMNSKPSRKTRESLANSTGLKPRVVQVWFQIKKTDKSYSDVEEKEDQQIITKTAKKSTECNSENNTIITHQKSTFLF
ncbi:hypothetical protein A3Q56_05551 [Intoshia linei]|uniref:Homeobox domain-containing protein n=1 Tax=Intoshia linei TaxID=1819745 RepID=A0A177AZ73_9BILA|nr:hypothetical protein A3Q56_05551 [Intoshia linei]